MTGLPINAGVNFKAEDNVCAFTKIRFVLEDGDGFEVYPVMRVDITLAGNHLPTIMLNLAPQSLQAKSLGDNVEESLFLAQPEPLDSTLAQYLAEATKLQKRVRSSDVKAQLLVEITQSGEAPVQTVNITKWVLERVAVQETTAGALSLTVWIQHPMLLGAEGGMLPNIRAVPRPPGLSTKTNLVDLFIEVQEQFLKQAGVHQNDTWAGMYMTKKGEVSTEGIDCAPNLTEVNKLAQDYLKNAIAQFKENISWNNLGGSDLPFGKNGAGIDATYLSRKLWVSAGRSGNVYDLFREIFPFFDLIMSGAPSDEPLLVHPFVPWGRSSLTVFDGEISSITLPPAGGETASGILTGWHHSQTADSEFSSYKSVETQGQVTGSMEVTSLGGYLCPLMKEPHLLGPIRGARLPAWLEEYALDAASWFNKTTNAASLDNMNKSIKPLRVFQQEQAAAKGYDISDFVQTWAKHRFFAMLHQNNQIVINTRLMLTSPSATTPGGYLRPGMVVKISSVADPAAGGQGTETPVLYFYLGQVRHLIDPAAKSAYTILSGNYVRFIEAIPAANITEEAIVNGIPNPLYETVGQFTQESVEE